LATRSFSTGSRSRHPARRDLGFVGASGAGKSVLLRTVLGLNKKRAGTIRLFGVDLDEANEEERLQDRHAGRRAVPAWRAVFGADRAGEHPGADARISRPAALADGRARLLKIELVGLPPTRRRKFPSELSGGMIKRAALARALALDPDIVFLDEPTSGLDPIGAAEFDELVGKLRDTMGLTVYMVTHDLDSLFSVCDRVAVLGKKKVLVEGTIEDMLKSEEPWVKVLFPRKTRAAA
jgi:phospholipid/cholesterol/gamma-HCH transport system ATP-binding protein